MHPDYFCLESWTPHTRNRSDSFPLTVVFLYDDMHSAMRAMRTLERLGGRLEGRMHAQIKPLLVEHLHDSFCYYHSLEDARDADIVVISINDTGKLPSIVKSWIDDFAAQKHDGECAMVALLGTEDETDDFESSRLNYLRAAARSAGADFFAPEPDGKIPALESFAPAG